MVRAKPAALALAALALAAAACATPSAPARVEDYRIADGYAARRPADVAVPAPAGEIPAGAGTLLREAVRASLLRRDYAPVRSAEVDRDPGAFRPGGPNAVVEIRVLAWDEARLYADGTIRVDAEARLYGPGATEALYVARLGAYDARAPRVPVSSEGAPAARGHAIADLAEKLLERLPVKGDG